MKQQQQHDCDALDLLSAALAAPDGIQFAILRA
jgi:hypothetical protein